MKVLFTQTFFVAKEDDGTYAVYMKLDNEPAQKGMVRNTPEEAMQALGQGMEVMASAYDVPGIVTLGAVSLMLADQPSDPVPA